MSEEATATQEVSQTTETTDQTVLGSPSGDSASTEATQAAEAVETYINADGSLREGWTNQYPELEGFNLDKFKSVDALAKSYAHLERQKGGSYYPQEDWNDEKVAAYREAAGVPESPDGYQLRPEDLPEGMTWDDDYSNAIAGIMHKYHIPARAAHEMVQADLEHRQSVVNDFNQHFEQSKQEAEKSLREEWGLKYDANLESAKKAFVALARETGMDAEQAEEISQKYGNEPALLKLFSKVGYSIQEAAMHGLSRSQADSFKGDRERLTELVQSDGYMKADPATIREIDELTKRIAESEAGKFV